MLQVFLLGNFRVVVDGRPVEEAAWTRRKVKSLLKLLALQPGYRLHKEQALEMLWPDLDLTAASGNLYRTLHLLRQIFQSASSAPAETNFVLLKEEVIRLNSPSEIWVDVNAFEQLLGRARAESEAETIISLLEQALQLYQGDLLPEDLYEEWAIPRREELKRIYQQSLLQLAILYRQRQQYSPAIGLLQKILNNDQANESAHRELVIVYTLAGQRSEALTQYQRCLNILNEELGLDPSPETLEVYRQVLAGEIRAELPTPELLTSPTPATASAAPSRTADQTSTEIAAPPATPVEPAPAATPVSVGYYNNLPAQLTSLVGREEEVRQAIELLSEEGRLLTLTGRAGVGKTRVALQVAWQFLEDGHFAQGVCFVPLSALRDPALLLMAIAQATGIKEAGGQPLLALLKHFLKDLELLLLLDNFEQVQEAAEVLNDLLSGCPRLKLLVTSRSLLHLYGEHELIIAPLALPAARPWLALDEIRQAQAVKLFTQRAQAASSSFRLTESNASAILEICRRLDGLPLAIELVAARVKLLSPETLLSRLDSWLHLMSSPARNLPSRQQTLQNALDWSYDLLNEAEQQTFTRLAVFSRSCSLEAIEQICVYNASLEGKGKTVYSFETLELITALVDKSLLQAQETILAPGLTEVAQFLSAATSPRFRMLEILHEYALERLQGGGEEEQLRECHLDYYLEMVELIEPKLHSKNLFPLLSWLELEHDNLRTALRWSLENSANQPARFEKGLRLAGALAWFWHMRGYWSEGSHWLEKGLGQLPPYVKPVILAKALYCAGLMNLNQGNAARSNAQLEQSLQIYRELDDKWGMAHVLDVMAEVARQQGNYAKAKPLYEGSRKLCNELDDEFCANHEVIGLGYVSYQQGDYGMAHSFLKEGLAVSQELNDKVGAARALNGLGELFRREEKFVEAANSYQQSLKLYRELGQTGNVVLVLHNLGQLELSQKNYAKADSFFRSSLLLAFEIKSKRHIGWCLAGLACVAVGQEKLERAGQLFGAAQMLLETIGSKIDPTNQPSYDEELARLRSKLDASTLAEEWRTGQALSIEEALALILDGGVFSFELY